MRQSRGFGSVRLHALSACALFVAAIALGCGRPALDHDGPVADWPAYGGDLGGLRFSPLTQITPENVASLRVAWKYHHGDFADGSGDTARTSFPITPIVANDTLYFCTGFMRVIALDPETGEERWSFDPELRARRGEGPYPLACRGVTYWEDPEPAGGACAKRIFHGTRDSELIALDADTGKPCAGFGDGGRVALREGLGEGIPAWEYYPTSPPVVVRGVVAIGALGASSAASTPEPARCAGPGTRCRRAGK